MYLLHKLNFY